MADTIRYDDLQTERERQDYQRIAGGLGDAREYVVEHNRPFNVKNLGFTEVDTIILPNSKNQIAYEGGMNRLPRAIVGNIRDRGSNIIIYHDKKRGGDFNGGFTRADLLRDLGTVVDAAAKHYVDPQVGLILPEGELDGRGDGDGSAGGACTPEHVRAYQEILPWMVENSKKIRVASPNGDFNQDHRYIVLETNAGWFVAYSPKFGEAPYVVADFDDLKMNKPELRRSGAADRIVRRLGGTWDDRLKGYFLDK